MAYKLLDQNGNYIEPNGMHKGTILYPYAYNGMELYNENAVASNRYPFYNAFFGGRRRVRIGSSYYFPSGTKKKYVDEAYAATVIAIDGSYSSSSYKDYEVYKDGNLVASGSFTNSLTDIYVCQKEANTSIIVRGIWDETNSKFIYNITTNATIERTDEYKWDNSTELQLNFFQCNAGYSGSNKPFTSVTDTRVTFYNEPNISTIIKNYYGCDEVIINSIIDQFQVLNSGINDYYFTVYDDSGKKLKNSTLLEPSRVQQVQVVRPSSATYYTGKYGTSSESTDANFNSSDIHFDKDLDIISLQYQTIYNVTLKFYPKRPVMRNFTFQSLGRMYCDGFQPLTKEKTVSSPSDKLNFCEYGTNSYIYIYLNGTQIKKIYVEAHKTYNYTLDVSSYTSISCSKSYDQYNITAE